MDEGNTQGQGTQPKEPIYGVVANNQLHEGLLKKDLSIISEEASFNYKCYIFAFLGALQLGSKMVLISMANCNETWIFFIEHMMIWLTCFIVISFTRGFSNFCVSGPNKVQIFTCAFLSGSTNAIGNVFIIFAMKHALQSGTSPATISTILMFNVLLILIAGLAIFRERHKPMKYFGGVIVLAGLIIITSQRSFETEGSYTQKQNSSYSIAIICVIMTTIFWGMTNVLGKYASYFYGAEPLQFGALATTCSGAFGSCSIVVIWLNEVPFELGEGYSFLPCVSYCMICGIFTALALFCFYKALSLGSGEVTQLIFNTKILVQMIEEMIIFGVLPSLVSFCAMVGVFIGVTIMIFTKETRNLRYEESIELKVRV